MSEAVLRSYVQDVETALRAGSATEHTYRSYLKSLIEKLAPGVVATNEPKHIRNCGAPDFIITRNQTPLGYIETKDVGIPLDAVERSDQMRRYLGGLANLLLTDYVEFRWYVAGQHRVTARLVTTKGASKGKSAAKWQLDPGGVQQVSDLLQGFLLAQAPTVNNPKELATRMAAIAQLMRNAISLAFKSEDGAGSLHGQLEGFRQVLLPDLDAEQFADMYAQSICYGLFAARCNAQPGRPFSRELAAFEIPKTNPFLRRMFNYIAGPDLDERVVWAVDDLASVLNHTDMAAILRDFGRRTRQEDPVVHFYETFLAAYDSRMRETRGVYYTPEPVVSYIVRSVDALLKKEFNLSGGLADATKIALPQPDGTTRETHKVQILDPATGTGTFLHSVIDLIYETFRGNKGMWSGYVSQHLLPRLFGFELLMAPYAVAHMKLGLQLAETGYDFKSNERLGVYLTNTLEESFGKSKLPFVEWLVEEASAASSVKHDAPVMVVLGNPPYSGHSANKGQWIAHLLHGKDDMDASGAKVGNYFEVDGKELGEQNPKYLYDDYVKFIRFAQWRIEHTGYGILAIITNHGYLDNPTFRGMRRSLMQCFDDIYVLDLHGNSKRKERSPDGNKDENVFDIQQGVAIGLFVKRKEKTTALAEAKVYHADLWGDREVYEQANNGRQIAGGKYYWLATHNISTTEWTKLEPQKPFYLFKPQNINARLEYERGWKVTDLFLMSTNGVKTHRDHFVMDFNRAALHNRIENFKDLSISDSAITEMYDLHDTRDWKLNTRRKSLASNTQWKRFFTRILYRPFDYREYFHHEDVVELPRHEIMKHMVNMNNFGLLTNRQVRLNTIEHFWVTKYSTDFHVLETAHASASLFPLYLYNDHKQDNLFDENKTTETSERRPNLAPAFIADITGRLGLRFVPDGRGDLRETLGPEDIFDYLYAVFHAPTYRARYAEFLKIDFPRLPLTSDADLFRALCQAGRRLVALHLMEQPGESLPNYPASGNNVVEKVEFRVANGEDAGRVYINATQYFDGVPVDVWNFHVGGYQVCHKWLKDRKSRALAFDDINHYRHIVAALAATITLMQHIDETIEEHGGYPLT